MKKEKCALLVIDMQLVAFDGKITPPIANGSQLLDRVSTLIDACRSARAPVIFLQTCAQSGQPYARDAHGWEIHAQAAPQRHEEIYFKVGPSGFENPRLHEHLTEIGIDTAIVCGIWSEGCVAFTAESALESGYDVTLDADGHGTVRDSHAEAELVVAEQNDRLRRREASVRDTEEILEQLRS